MRKFLLCLGLIPLLVSAQVVGPYASTSSMNSNAPPGTVAPNTLGIAGGNLYDIGSGPVWSLLLSSYFSQSFVTGALTSVLSTKFGFRQANRPSSVDTIYGSAMSLVCVTNPTLTLYDCGSDATCASPTTVGSVTVTTSGQGFVGTVTAPTVASGDWIAAAITGGVCTVLNVTLTTNMHTTG